MNEARLASIVVESPGSSRTIAVRTREGKSPGLFWRSGIIKGRPLAPAHVTKEGELRNNQNCSSDLADTQVHLPALIVKDPQTEQLLNCVIGGGDYVIPADPKQHKQAAPDGSDYSIFNPYAGFRDSLDDGTHQEEA